MDINDEIKKLSVEEKINFLRGKDFWQTQPIEALNLKPIRMHDGPNGLRKERDDGEQSFTKQSEVAVCFPSACLTSCSFDIELLFKMGDTLGKEALNQGIDILLGPGVNIKRNPLCGRNFEYFSEDPYLAGELATSYVKGVQQNNVGTSLKHFAVNSQEIDRSRINEIVDERSLFEIYLEPFRRCVTQAKPASVMSSYNKINGFYASENKFLLKDVLRDKWGFDGFVVSDWGGVNDSILSLKNGLNLEMPNSDNYNYFKLLKAYKNRVITESEIDELVRENYYHFKKYENNEPIPVDLLQDHRFAVTVAKESMVLLKNDGILPLDDGESVMFVGEFVTRPRFQGGGSARVNPYKIVPFMNEIKRYNSHSSYFRGYDSSSLSKSRKLIREAVANAINKDKIVLFLGTRPEDEVEGYDRKSINLPESQLVLLRELLKVNKNIVCVLECGSVLNVEEAVNSTRGTLLAYFGGEGGNEAIASILFGKTNPSGRLSETWIKNLEQSYIYNYLTNNRIDSLHKESIYVGYRYYGKNPSNILFPFGYGLSYSDVTYSNFEIDKTRLEKNGKVKISFDLANETDLTHKEVVQIYVSKPNGTVFNPIRELKGFEKVIVEPHSSFHVETYLDYEAFAYYDINQHDFVVLEGDYGVSVCKNAEEVINEFAISVEGEYIESPYLNKAEKYFKGEVCDISLEEFKEIYPSVENYDEEKLGVTIDWNCSIDFMISKGSKGAKFLKSIIKKIPQLSKDRDLYHFACTSPLRQLTYFANIICNDEQREIIYKIFRDEQYIRNTFKYFKILINTAKQMNKKGE